MRAFDRSRLAEFARCSGLARARAFDATGCARPASRRHCLERELCNSGPRASVVYMAATVRQHVRCRRSAGTRDRIASRRTSPIEARHLQYRYVPGL